MGVHSVTTTKIEGIDRVYGSWGETIDITLDDGNKVEIVVDSLKLAESLRDAVARNINRLVERQRKEAEKLLEKNEVED